jgi:hypothetical protein
MHPPEIRAEVLRLVGEGHNDCEISRRTGIPRATVRDMRAPRYVRKTQGSLCPRCWTPGKPVAFNGCDYAEILGLYLGDGHITRLARTDRLRIFFDSKYPVLLAESKELLTRFFPANRVGSQYQHGGTMTILRVHNAHLRCLFPQHGPGMKHSRLIELEPWQEELATREPWPLIRGLIRSDGCSFVNRTGPYEYLSYGFSNTSVGITTILVDALRRVGVRYRVNWSRRGDIWVVRINRRESVAKMVDQVGIKL